MTRTISFCVSSGCAGCLNPTSGKSVKLILCSRTHCMKREALWRLATQYLVYRSPRPGGDPVARASLTYSIPPAR